MNKLLAALGALAIAGAAQATPVQWSGNGHWYDYVSGDITWSAANAAASASTYFDGTQTLQGYLATITSSGENNFIGTVGSGWIGGSDAAQEGAWLWVTGPEAGTALTFTSWNSGEPNNAGGNENYLDFQNGNWNDLPDGPYRGYIVEYSATSTDVPEPAMLGLFGLGALGLATARRRKA